ncbi:MAG: hypothetical protein FJX00_02500 [Alphaproteobacteria bacterium]|nr:hypothetical protein [Alphaproteobacteria bacterium]
MIQFFWDTSDQTHLDPLSAVLNHAEGKPATLTITVRSHQVPESQRLRGQWGRLMYAQPHADSQSDPNVPQPEQERAETTHLLFYGKTVGFTEKHGHIDIHLMSEKAPFKSQWPDVRNAIKAKNQHHELWPEDDPENMLCSVPYAWYWDRCTGALGLSHAIDGHKTWDLSDYYDPKYYVIQKNEPVSQINVQISALWDQSILDYVDVAPDIAKQFRNRVIGTLTDRALESAWPETGRFFSSGYFVAHSALMKKPSSTHHPNAIVFSPQATQEDSAGPPSQWVAETHFYDAKLVMGYFYRQKRKEQVTYTLTADLPHHQHGRAYDLDIALPPFVRYDDLPLWNPGMTYEQGEEVQHQGRVYRFYGDGGQNMSQGGVQDMVQDMGQYKHLSRNGFDPSQQQWQEIPEKSKWLLPAVSDSFFNLTLGKELFQYTLHRAKTALIWGTRCMEIQLRGTLKAFHAITLNDCFSWGETNGSDKKIIGKVVDYTLNMDGAHHQAYIQIKGAFFMPFNDAPAPAINDEKIIVMDGLQCLWPENNPPADILSQKIKDKVCKKIDVFNPIEDQLQHLESLQEKMWTDDWNTNSVHAKETRIRLHFHSLRTSQCLEHTIPVTICTPYNPEHDE